ncbi:MAG: hypothetical protein R3C18_07215 [Planctomycetaceae bacterium]
MFKVNVFLASLLFVICLAAASKANSVPAPSAPSACEPCDSGTGGGCD